MPGAAGKVFEGEARVERVFGAADGLRELAPPLGQRGQGQGARGQIGSGEKARGRAGLRGHEIGAELLQAGHDLGRGQAGQGAGVALGQRFGQARPCGGGLLAVVEGGLGFSGRGPGFSLAFGD